mgnify:CR=1
MQYKKNESVWVVINDKQNSVCTTKLMDIQDIVNVNEKPKYKFAELPGLIPANRIFASIDSAHKMVKKLNNK